MKTKTLYLLTLTLASTSLVNGAISLTSAGNGAAIGSPITLGNATSSSGSNTVNTVSFDFAATPLAGSSFEFPNNFAGTANITNIAAPSGEFVDGLSLSIEDIFDGGVVSTFTVTVSTNAGNSLSFNITEGGVNPTINVFSGPSSAATFDVFTTQLNSDPIITTTGAGLVLGDDDQADDLVLVFGTTGGEAITGFDISHLPTSGIPGDQNEGIVITGVDFTTSTIPVPEPTTGLLGLLSLVALTAKRRR